MDVTGQLKQVWILLAENRPVAIREEMSVAPVSPVEGHRVPGQEPPHHRGDGNSACSQEEMNVIGKKGPGVAGGRGLRKNAAEPIKEALPVGIVVEDLSPLDPSDDQVV